MKRRAISALLLGLTLTSIAGQIPNIGLDTTYAATSDTAHFDINGYASFGGLTYKKISDTEVSVYHGDDYSTDAIVIPSSVQVDGIRYAVTAIGANAFQSTRASTYGYGARTISVPSSIKSIGTNAFFHLWHVDQLDLSAVPISAFQNGGAVSMSGGATASRIKFSGMPLNSSGWIIPSGYGFSVIHFTDSGAWWAITPSVRINELDTPATKDGYTFSGFTGKSMTKVYSNSSGDGTNAYYKDYTATYVQGQPIWDIEDRVNTALTTKYFAQSTTQADVEDFIGSCKTYDNMQFTVKNFKVGSPTATTRGLLTFDVTYTNTLDNSSETISYSKYTTILPSQDALKTAIEGYPGYSSTLTADTLTAYVKSKIGQDGIDFSIDNFKNDGFRTSGTFKMSFNGSSISYDFDKVDTDVIKGYLDSIVSSIPVSASTSQATLSSTISSMLHDSSMGVSVADFSNNGKAVTGTVNVTDNGSQLISYPLSLSVASRTQSLDDVASLVKSKFSSDYCPTSTTSSDNIIDTVKSLITDKAITASISNFSNNGGTVSAKITLKDLLQGTSKDVIISASTVEQTVMNNLASTYVSKTTTKSDLVTALMKGTDTLSNMLSISNFSNDNGHVTCVATLTDSDGNTSNFTVDKTAVIESLTQLETDVQGVLDNITIYTNTTKDDIRNQVADSLKDKSAVVAVTGYAISNGVATGTVKITASDGTTSSLPFSLSVENVPAQTIALLGNYTVTKNTTQDDVYYEAMSELQDAGAKVTVSNFSNDGTSVRCLINAVMSNGVVYNSVINKAYTADNQVAVLADSITSAVLSYVPTPATTAQTMLSDLTTGLDLSDCTATVTEFTNDGTTLTGKIKIVKGTDIQYVPVSRPVSKVATTISLLGNYTVTSATTQNDVLYEIYKEINDSSAKVTISDFSNTNNELRCRVAITMSDNSLKSATIDKTYSPTIKSVTLPDTFVVSSDTTADDIILELKDVTGDYGATISVPNFVNKSGKVVGQATIAYSDGSSGVCSFYKTYDYVALPGSVLDTFKYDHTTTQDDLVFAILSQLNDAGAKVVISNFLVSDTRLRCLATITTSTGATKTYIIDKTIASGGTSISGSTSGSGGASATQNIDATPNTTTGAGVTTSTSGTTTDAGGNTTNMNSTSTSTDNSKDTTNKTDYNTNVNNGTSSNVDANKDDSYNNQVGGNSSSTSTSTGGITNSTSTGGTSTGGTSTDNSQNSSSNTYNTTIVGGDTSNQSSSSSTGGTSTDNSTTNSATASTGVNNNSSTSNGTTNNNTGYTNGGGTGTSSGSGTSGGTDGTGGTGTGGVEIAGSNTKSIYGDEGGTGSKSATTSSTTSTSTTGTETSGTGSGTSSTGTNGTSSTGTTGTSSDSSYWSNYWSNYYNNSNDKLKDKYNDLKDDYSDLKNSISDLKDSVKSGSSSSTQASGGTPVVNNISGSGADTVVGWQQDFYSGRWYLYNISGKRVTGWQRYENHWYYLDANTGALQTGWFSLNDKDWYYLKVASDGTRGMMLTGWQKIDNSWYYIDPSTGVMSHDTTVDGYQLGHDGKLV